ncbi:hypothetical protein FA13DRAFT_1788577 [Coprinellus micaceus]|uniref:DUF7053 domain-containing protein n=1 Tax=Coprinellus micaceus TaxID=71717 RepID=A0A4Y7TM34_COPMI|nr:hypothetical protein FA13DRAFT_1788577 [Coprinellus micaceus]
MGFTSTREFTYQREISAPHESVLAILQDPYRLCSHSPHFAGMVPDDVSPCVADTQPPSDSPVEENGRPVPCPPSKEGRLSTNQWYKIYDRIPVLGPLKTTITIRAKIVPVEGGVETEVEAGFGTRVKTKYTVEGGAGENTGCVLKETTVLEALSIMMPYVWKTMENGHLHSFDGIRKEVEVSS